ncbi:type II CAAX endopeptidase family protein [Dyella sp. A6]|uniref:CPBP family intramembrane glutamic endopeptidase n=1 Tax=Dyella aluminiiresistens TaxID=3069105 RepID=UPI002E787DCC|nr:type II CAAX endopeptidase family protein [Dyella sp. A6]
MNSASITSPAELPPLPPPAARIDNGPPQLPQAPGLWSAVGMIALYFLLQLALSVAGGFMVGLVVGLKHMGETGARIRQQVSAIMQQPDALTLMVVLTVPLAALVVMTVVRRNWPRLWTQAYPPGFGMRRPVTPAFFVIAATVGLLVPPLGGLITQWLAHGQQVTQNVAQMGQSATPAMRALLLVVVVSVGPLVEELLFRGVLLSALLRRFPTAWSVAACVLLFGLVHLPGLHFRWYALPDLMLLALALCWLRLKSGSLWPSVLAHGVNNLVAMVALFVTVAHHHT